MEKGYVTLMLHAHLPFVRHPEHAFFTEELWLYEALTETYIPLLHMMEGLQRDGVDFRLTMSITPPLVSMLQDGLLQERYSHHINKLVELAEKEIDRTSKEPRLRSLAHMYRDRFAAARSTFDRYQRNLVNGFRAIQDAGQLEIITCPATHGFLPLMNQNTRAMRGQIVVAADHYERAFGRRPEGIWLGECGFVPGVDALLRDVGIRYFFVDTHAILFGTQRPVYGVFAPIFTPAGVAAFGRDVESSKQVWSAKEGYPGDPVYRDFYRDVGFDLDLDYVGPYIHPDGIRLPTGIKYHRVTGEGIDLGAKELYDPHEAWEHAADHAGNFMFNREKQIEHLAEHMDRKPIVVCPYDAELFGHWWYEGPMFLDFFFRKVAYDQLSIAPITPAEYLDEYPTNQLSIPAASSWGYQGYNEYWLNGSNDWVYPHLHKAAERMVELAERFRAPSDLERRALNQAVRELLLAQSSDWAFIMKTDTAVPYALKRTRDHIERFTRLYNDLMADGLHEGFLASIESMDSIFPDVDYRVYG